MAKVFIEETTLTAIGDAIRGKEGTTALVPVNDMATRISSIQTGSDPVIEALEITSNGTYTATDCDGYSPITVNVPQDGAPDAQCFIITGNCGYRFANNGWNWFINQYGNQLTTNNITDASNMFRGSNSLTNIPFDINLTTSVTNVDCSYLFYTTKITQLPYVKGSVGGVSCIISNCNHLREIPEDWASYITWDYIHSYTYAGLSGVFSECSSLRKIPASLMAELWGIGTSSIYVPYGSMFNRCYVLDEAVNVPVQQSAFTSNRFASMFLYCHRLKDFTFATNEDGTPKTANWKSQTIDLSQYVGYASAAMNCTQHNSGLTYDTWVQNESEYQALKDNPDWFTNKLEYSRYNKISAINTINSLPDTSAYGTNTIKFEGDSGSATDGGAINTLTEEEIAVATAKGWTVTFV